MTMSAIAGLALLGVGAEAGEPNARRGSGDLEELVEELLRVKDDAHPEQIRELAMMRTPEALEGLIKVYDALGSIYMRRVAMEGMVVYDDVPEADQRALQKLMDVATDSEVRELRNSAVDCIAECSHLKKPFLRMIVESSADDEVRESAMTYHTEHPRPDDLEWYDEVYDPSALVKARKAAKKAAAEKEKVPHKLGALRALAFDAVAKELPEEEVVEAIEDETREIRLRALEEVDARGIKAGLKAAEGIYKKPKEWAALRLTAVRVLASHGDGKIIEKVMKDALRTDSTREFANGVAEILADSDDESLQRSIAKAMALGTDFEKVFRMRAGWQIEDPKVDKALAKLTKDKKSEVRLEAVAAIGRRGNVELIGDLERILDRDKDPLVVAAAVGAITTLGGSGDWMAKLAELARHEHEDVRNAAVEELGETGDPAQAQILVEAMNSEQWSTRLKAARALERLRVDSTVGDLIARMEQEDGRMQAELGTILWRLTGQPLRNEPARWKAWWAKEGDGFQILSAEELTALEEKKELHRLKQVTRTSFFGIRVVSHRVIFIIDISGSMDRPTRGRFVGETGERRMDVAKKELDQCLDSLDVESLFNIVTFADSASAWQDRVSEWTNVSLAEAKEYVSRQEAFGGTNLFGALDIAFRDAIVDTIYVLSDGNPTVGEQQDPGQIRETVAEWNRHRGVEIHCIAVGGDLDTLQWLAEDSGGQYVRIP
jgi:HEAT repeat protein